MTVKNLKRHLFIAGTDTGVGKTLVTGLFARYYSDKGYRVVTQKCVETGSGSSRADIEEHSRISRVDNSPSVGRKTDRVPYSFRDPVSPHLASRKENRKISIPRILGAFERLTEQYEIVIVEGAGGVMVPINSRELMLDIIKAMSISVVVVASNRLGAINHTLLTVRQLKSEGLNVTGIVFNNVERGGRKDILRDNPLTVKAFTGTNILANIPFSNDIDKLYGVFRKDLEERIL
ncbi:MAG: dethiobiotin synthase [Candidatus Omnitrophica bacterium]|nr:dethiobiotin synthase [Candidatus Omnitrophota bacterium]